MGYGRPKDDVASLAYDAAIHERARLKAVLRKTSTVEAASWTPASSAGVTVCLLRRC